MKIFSSETLHSLTPACCLIVVVVVWHVVDILIYLKGVDREMIMQREEGGRG